MQRNKAKQKGGFNYHKPIFDNYEPIKYNMNTGEWEMTNIVKNTRFINIEKDLKDRMRVKGRFPIPDPIKKTKEHPKNDENIILRADSLIESAYDSEKGEEWVRNEDYLIPGILSPLQSEISMHKVDLYSSTDEEEDDLLNDVSNDHKRKDILSPRNKNRRMSNKASEPEFIKEEKDSKSRDGMDMKTDKTIPAIESKEDDKNTSKDDFLNQNITSTDVVKTEGNELEKADTFASKEIKEENRSTTPGISQTPEQPSVDDELKFYFGSSKVATKFPFKIQNFKSLSAQSVENIT